MFFNMLIKHRFQVTLTVTFLLITLGTILCCFVNMRLSDGWLFNVIKIILSWYVPPMAIHCFTDILFKYLFKKTRIVGSINSPSKCSSDTHEKSNEGWRATLGLLMFAPIAIPLVSGHEITQAMYKTGR